ncbi:MAG: hypothetical protein Q9207_000713 [Kuettlingeria erythrocarpa]
MARTKPTHSSRGKKIRTISTSGIFKAHKRHDSRKNGEKDLAIPRLRKRRPRPEHWLSKGFSASVDHSRKYIEETSTGAMDTARDGLLAQTRVVLQEARNRTQEVDRKISALTRPLCDEMLELTRKDGTIITTTLGKRMSAYRKMVTHEEKTLNRLLEQWTEVSNRINDFATKLFGSQGARSITSIPNPGVADFESVEERELIANLEAEKKRVQDAAAAAGEKAMRAVKANEKVRRLLC